MKMTNYHGVFMIASALISFFYAFWACHEIKMEKFTKENSKKFFLHLTKTVFVFPPDTIDFMCLMIGSINLLLPGVIWCWAGDLMFTISPIISFIGTKLIVKELTKPAFKCRCFAQ